MSKAAITEWIEKHKQTYTDMAQDIWDHPQTAYEEKYASELQRNALQAEGFSITQSINGIDTAFVAEYGQGKPIIGILGEFDALPGLSQKATPEKEEVIANGPGHGCGHNLLGTAGVEAVIALKERMEKDNLTGTIRYYGCPAEEVLSGKTHMAKAGVFDDLDCALTWHPMTNNAVMHKSMQSMVSIKFHFKGKPAHAAASPEAGRSALDSVELMNIGVNYLREHVPDGTRMHYTITDGGQAPNIVPETATVWYFLRASSKEEVEGILHRVKNIAKGAALMNETEVDSEILAFAYDTLPNDPLNELMYQNMLESTPLTYVQEEHAFIESLAASLPTAGKPVEELLPASIHFNAYQAGESLPGSTDVGDVSWIVPTGMVTTTCAPVGTALHSWQATASFGTQIGYKGMHLAASTMALSAYDLLINKDNILDKAKETFERLRDGKEYQAGI
ncbi:amidohydrolase [Oceanobacillus polygoni]|uniref:Aminobenzoyl-glutamate utilization protein B n=1 Tax=Oceanobacillus polygoni TaxID=1235259 RepID=A0A9X1CFF8_9BACI|nr:amidohydrolase [Oceanobacillus polygoni]MBP2076813.1 aminobenzoyl-glutamate utilization protein B [Oceanobacillus polygoni]